MLFRSPNSTEQRNSKIPSPKAVDLRQSNHRLNKEINNRRVKTAVPPNVKEIRFYRNGDIHQEEQLVSLDFASTHDWNDCLELINRKVIYPGTIQVLFTLRGKKLSCIAELEKETDVVVSGKSPFRLLAYGPSKTSPNTSRTPVCRPNSGRRTARAGFTKSVILEPASVVGGGDGNCSFLSKTVSELNVSGRSGFTPSPFMRGEYRNSVSRSNFFLLNTAGDPILFFDRLTVQKEDLYPAMLQLSIVKILSQHGASSLMALL